MKLIYAVLLLVVVTNFVSAKSEKHAGAAATQGFYLLDAEAKAVRVGQAGAQLPGKLSEVPNITSCTQFANRFLESRGLGSLDLPQK